MSLRDILTNRTLRKARFSAVYSESILPADSEPIVTPAEANVVCSDSTAAQHTCTVSHCDHSHQVGNHYPVIDLDVPATLVESSTAGHTHLYIEHAVSWEKYVHLLEALADCGIVEHDYVAMSKRRGYSAVRLPWVAKKRHDRGWFS